MKQPKPKPQTVKDPYEFHIRVRDNALGDFIVSEALQSHRLPSQMVVHMLHVAWGVLQREAAKREAVNGR